MNSSLDEAYASPVQVGGLGVAGGVDREVFFGFAVGGWGAVAPAWNFKVSMALACSPLADAKRSMVLAVAGDTWHGIRASDGTKEGRHHVP